jgi:predicted DsbA family dithiol-disulfide isomerase
MVIFCTLRKQRIGIVPKKKMQKNINTESTKLEILSDLTPSNIKKFLQSNDKEKLVEEVESIIDWKTATDIKPLQKLVDTQYSDNKEAFYSLYPVIAEKNDFAAKGADKLFLAMVKKLEKEGSEKQEDLLTKIVDKSYSESFSHVYSEMASSQIISTSTNEKFLDKMLNFFVNHLDAKIVPKLLSNLLKNKNFCKKTKHLKSIVEGKKASVDNLRIVAKKAGDLSKENAQAVFRALLEHTVASEDEKVLTEITKSKQASVDNLRIVAQKAGSLSNKENAQAVFSALLKHTVASKDEKVLTEIVKSAHATNKHLEKVVDFANDHVIKKNIAQRIFGNVLSKTASNKKSILEKIAKSVKASVDNLRIVAKKAGDSSEEDAQAVFSALLNNKDAIKDKDILVEIAKSVKASPANLLAVAQKAGGLINKENAQAVFSALLSNPSDSKDDKVLAEIARSGKATSDQLVKIFNSAQKDKSIIYLAVVQSKRFSEVTDANVLKALANHIYANLSYYQAVYSALLKNQAALKVVDVLQPIAKSQHASLENLRIVAQKAGDLSKENAQAVYSALLEHTVASEDEEVLTEIAKSKHASSDNFKSVIKNVSFINKKWVIGIYESLLENSSFAKDQSDLELIATHKLLNEKCLSKILKANGVDASQIISKVSKNFKINKVTDEGLLGQLLEVSIKKEELDAQQDFDQFLANKEFQKRSDGYLKIIQSGYATGAQLTTIFNKNIKNKEVFVEIAKSKRFAEVSDKKVFKALAGYDYDQESTARDVYSALLKHATNEVDVLLAIVESKHVTIEHLQKVANKAAELTNNSKNKVFSALLSSELGKKDLPVLRIIAEKSINLIILRVCINQAMTIEDSNQVFSLVLDRHLSKDKDILQVIAGSTNASEGNLKIVAESASNLGSEDAQAVFSKLLQNATAVKIKDVLLAIAGCEKAGADNLKIVAESASNLGSEDAQAVFSALLQKEDLKGSKDILLAIAACEKASEGNLTKVAESASKLENDTDKREVHQLIISKAKGVEFLEKIAKQIRLKSRKRKENTSGDSETDEDVKIEPLINESLLKDLIDYVEISMRYGMKALERLVKEINKPEYFFCTFSVNKSPTLYQKLLKTKTVQNNKEFLLAIAGSTNASEGNLTKVAESASNLQNGEDAKAVFSTLLQNATAVKSKDVLLAIAGSANASEGNLEVVAQCVSKLKNGKDAQAVFSELLQNDAAKKTPEVINIIGNFALPKAKDKFNGQTGAKFTLSSLSALISGVVLIQNALVSAVAMGAVGGFMLLTHLICFLIEKANPAKAWVQYVMPILEVGLTALVVYYLPALLPLAGFSLVMSPQMWLLMVPVGASCLTRWLCQFSTSDSQLNTAYNNVLSSRAINKDSSIQTADTNNISEDLQTLMDNCLTTKTSIK